LSRRTLARLAVGVVGIAVLAGSQLLGPSTASASISVAAPRVLFYDASRAAEFVDAVNQGASNWNSSVTNVKLQPVPAGRRANITVVADNGWPRAQVTSLGNGRIFMGRTAVRQGHHPPRIAAHEFGHILGLPDRRTGRCADLMSGSSAPASCKNAFPNANEAREVNNNFRSAGITAPAATTYRPVQIFVCTDY
jgi:snapalysin